MLHVKFTFIPPSHETLKFEATVHEADGRFAGKWETSLILAKKMRDENGCCAMHKNICRKKNFSDKALPRKNKETLIPLLNENFCANLKQGKQLKT